MADMVYNEVRFIGDPEKVKEIMKAMKSEVSVVDFEKMLPMTEEITKEFVSWYSWYDEFWGTSRNAEDAMEIEDDFVSFYTAWSPVEELFRTFSKEFPDIEIEYSYSTESMEFVRIQNGDFLD